MEAESRTSPAPQSVRLLLPVLREGTHDLHEQIESRLNLAEQFDYLPRYRHLLGRFYGFYAPLEKRLAAPDCTASWVTLEIDFEDRRKTGLLEADLAALGSSQQEIHALPVCPEALLPVLGTAAELAGCAYVLEGATLGGQIIGRHLEQWLGMRPGAPGARFFYGYGTRNGAMWKQFRDSVESFAAREAAADSSRFGRLTKQAVAAARQTFSGMERWLLADSAPFPVQKML